MKRIKDARLCAGSSPAAFIYGQLTLRDNFSAALYKHLSLMMTHAYFTSSLHTKSRTDGRKLLARSRPRRALRHRRALHDLFYQDRSILPIHPTVLPIALRNIEELVAVVRLHQCHRLNQFVQIFLQYWVVETVHKVREEVDVDREGFNGSWSDTFDRGVQRKRLQSSVSNVTTKQDGSCTRIMVAA